MKLFTRPRPEHVAFAFLTLSSAALADELYRQNPINTVGGYSSQDARNPGGLGWFSEVQDNFPAQANWTINRVEFWGGYVTSVPGHTHGFMIRFYADNNGAPGALLLTQDVMSFSEDVYFTQGGNNGYDYALTLNTPFVVPAAGQYWVSVVAILDRGGSSTEPQWGWAQALVMTPPHAIQHFFGQILNPNNADMSFVLYGLVGSGCGSADFDCDGDTATDFDIQAFFRCLAGVCPEPPCASSADFDGDGDSATDADIEAFFRVLAGGHC
jgi:hypothetical protein